ncbi:MAG: hypothetical protein R3180_00110 [Marinobacter sp.]|nr:hypothetical protein [Marinobacter sp.]
MATLIIPDNTPLAELDKFARSLGKRLQATPAHPKPEDTTRAHNSPVARPQPLHRLAD